MSELQKELDKDQAFIDEVYERIYCESDDWEDSIAEPEWIMEMTDLADKYLRRFKAAENGRRQVVQDKAKLIAMSEPKLNENQESVLKWLKDYTTDECITPIDTVASFWRVRNRELQPENWRLNKSEQAQVLQAFATWALDRC